MDLLKTNACVTDICVARNKTVTTETIVNRLQFNTLDVDAQGLEVQQGTVNTTGSLMGDGTPQNPVALKEDRLVWLAQSGFPRGSSYMGSIASTPTLTDLSWRFQYPAALKGLRWYAFVNALGTNPSFVTFEVYAEPGVLPVPPNPAPPLIPGTATTLPVSTTTTAVGYVDFTFDTPLPANTPFFIRYVADNTNSMDAREVLYGILNV